MALHHLSDMTLAELDRFVRQDGAAMHLSPADVIALHLHRQRRAYLAGRERPACTDAGAGDDSGPACHSLRLLLLGDETDAKLGLAALLLRGGGGVSRHEPLLLGLGAADDDGGGGSSAASPRMELLVPGVADVTASLRGELCLASDVVLLCFSVSARASFDALRRRWGREEVGRAFALLAQDLADTRHAAVWPATPVVVVGLVVEAGELPAEGHARPVAHAEAVQLAQALGARKYVEIHSDNLHHARSLVTQCVQVAHALQRSLAAEAGAAAVSFLAAAKQQMLRCHLKVPRPEGTMDLQAMQLRLHATPGITYFMAVDGADPRRHTSPVRVPHDGVVDLRPYRKRPGTVLRICGMARCAYASTVLEVAVPSTLRPPSGYFDAVWRRFVVVAAPDDATLAQREVRYTLDGTQPTKASALYVHPIALDVASSPDAPWGSWRSCLPPPPVICLAAFAAGEFASPTVTYEVPAVLDTPRIVYSPHDSTVCLASPHPTVDYRYTLDGTTPTPASPLYTGPLSLAADTTQQVRFVAFPKVLFPSREAVVYVPQGAVAASTAAAAATANGVHGASGRAFHTTRAAMMRGQSSAQKLRGRGGSSRTNSCTGGTAAGQRRGRVNGGSEEGSECSRMLARPPTPSSTCAVSPRLRTAVRAALSRRHDSNGSSSCSSCSHARTTARAAEGTPRQRRGRPRSASPWGWQGKKGGERKRASGGGVKTDAARAKCGSPLCKASDNVVVFEFPEPISLDCLTVRTPGDGTGPTSYEVEVKHAHGADFLSVGSGELQDVRGVQTMNVLGNARLLPIDKVRCVFGGVAASGFRVKDLKVHGKPFKCGDCEC
ncbi:putative ras-related GTP-binding protein [Trypanosoma conorhini]|uniref:Putative ras-related GTP-binding protein n=1 Tax=Trypanosoma conorhini TaxID=83891 RepID=A0A3R7LYR3_9TRYP|nr:putative ras-related GTP-binding protein [Trypanosoma conorhini]RNF23301.1 putative ras-related GTP-binding protein [Trypanosoma conorhini]